MSFNTDKLVYGEQYDYVTRTSFNQGILQTTGFVNESHINEAGIWSLGLLQMDFFYRKKKWYAGQFVRKIIPKFQLSTNSIQFFTTVLNALKKKLLSVLIRNVDKTFYDSIIYLPVKNGKINFDFIEKFVAELEAQHINELETQNIKELEAYLNVTGLKNYELSEKEEKVLRDFKTIVWEEYKFEDIFNIFTGRDVIIGKTKTGKIPLISHQNTNNGIVNKIEQLDNRRIFDFNKTISLADRGLFYATTQNENFHIGTRVKALVFKDNEKSLKERLFFVTSINKLQILFTDYSKNATNKLPTLKIKLPVKNNKIDYDTMEILISAIQKLVIKDIAKYNDMKIKTTKKVIIEGKGDVV